MGPRFRTRIGLASSSLVQWDNPLPKPKHLFFWQSSSIPHSFSEILKRVLMSFLYFSRMAKSHLPLRSDADEVELGDEEEVELGDEENDAIRAFDSAHRRIH